MTLKKGLARKIRLAKKTKQNRRIPIWVTMKTNRKWLQNPFRRNWRSNKLKL